MIRNEAGGGINLKNKLKCQLNLSSAQKNSERPLYSAFRQNEEALSLRERERIK